MNWLLACLSCIFLLGGFTSLTIFFLLWGTFEPYSTSRVTAVVAALICFALTYIFFKSIKPQIKKNPNTNEYKISNPFNIPIIPYITTLSTNRNYFAFYVRFKFSKHGLSNNSAIVKINIDGEELAIWLGSSSHKNINNISLTKEQYMFFSKLPSCQKAVICFIGSTGDIEKTVQINKFTKECMKLMMEEAESLINRGIKISFEEI